MKELEKLDKEIRDNRSKDDNFFDPKELGIIRKIIDAQPDTVMIYPLVGEQELNIQLYGKAGVVKTFKVPVGREELGNAVKEFRDLMEYCEQVYHCGDEEIPKVQAASQKLYNFLIKPIEAELKANPVKNLVFSLDRVTRYVPMSALFDGNQYLIEKYTIYLAPSASLVNTEKPSPLLTPQSTSVLAMGLSNGVRQKGNTPAFSALPNVPLELDFIVQEKSNDKQGVYRGQTFLNNTFSFNSLQNNLKKGHNILHLATHGLFDPKHPDESYILLGNEEPLTPKLIYNLVALKDIHLVVLSACQTALASPRQDGVEINAFAHHFLKNQVKSVIASLWQVADSSTSTLMQNFYNNLANSKQPITKAEAMRLAQLQLLYDKDVTVSDIKRAGGLIPEEILSSGKKPESKTFTHPYYWAPFVLIGNGL